MNDYLVSKFFKYCVIFSFIIILLIINAKITVSLKTSTYPRYTSDHIPGCSVSKSNSPKNTITTKAGKNNSIETKTNYSDKEDQNYETPMYNSKGRSKYVYDKDYNKFYWGNN